ncbi:TonB-dependent receptor SusC [termite gut metagenome]|uniref:TonB-dependent receptor SusC n=1 Tax=termite gut metagenome TaxID=433724 RepID=A0A5J4SB49_9ZZZZ
MKKLYLMLLCLFLWNTGVSNAQSFIVQGTVKGSDGLPLTGATVMLKGTQTGMLVDNEGRFSIKASDKNSILIISFLGYKTAEIKATPVMEIVLWEDTIVMGEVVVTGMVQTDKRLFTGAADRLNAEDLKLAGTPDISRSLAGRSAGVSGQDVSGTFGTAPKIRIRGATSIYGNSKPLWVVDGIIMDDVVEIGADELSSGDAATLISSAIAGLNADDIESFQILKDGSATSIYGARAMSGVIVVTTKRGKAGVSRINYTGEFTTRLKPNYQDFNIMNSQDQMGIYKELEAKGWLTMSSTINSSSYGVYGKMYHLMNTYDPPTGRFLLENTPEDKNSYLRQAEKRNTDWFDLLFENSIMMNHSVSMANGNDKSASYLSMSVMSDPGWTKKSSVVRYTANANASYNILNNLTMSILFNGSYRNQEAPGTLSQSVDPTIGQVKRDFDINPYSYSINSSRTLDPNEYYNRNYSPFNIFNELEQNYMELNVLDTRFQGDLKWKPVKELEFKVLSAVKYQTTAQQHFVMDNSNQSLAYRAMDNSQIRSNNSFLYHDPDKPNSLPYSVLTVGGLLDKTEYRMFSYDFRGSAAWNKVYDDKHIVNLYGGVEINSIERMVDWYRGWGLQYENGMIPFFEHEIFKKLRESNGDYYSIDNTFRRNVAFFGTGTYSYKGIYTFNLTGRYEGSNRLGKARRARWLPTWNVSGAWNIHEEKYFERFKSVFSHLMVKASYSLTAEAGPEWVANSHAVISSYNPWRPSSGTGESGLRIGDLENSELTYEKKHELNIGIDWGLFNGRINFATDWYKRNNYDLIGATTTQGVGGIVNKTANVASMESHGIEFTLSTKNFVEGKFKWDTDLTFGYNKNVVTDLVNSANVMAFISGTGFARKGYAVRSLFSIPFIGLDERGLPMFLIDGKEITHDNYSAINFQERESIDWLVYEGPADPTITGGVGNIFTYKNVRLNVFVTYSFGNKIRLDPVFSSSYSDMGASSKDFINRWRVPGDESETDIPVIANTTEVYRYGSTNMRAAYNAYNYSTVRVADGGFVRLKDLSLEYILSKNHFSSLKINDMSLKLQASNLWLLYADSKLNGQDPEFFRSGGVAVPMARQFTFTIKMGF